MIPGRNTKTKMYHLFLSSGLYRRYGNRTHSAVRLEDLSLPRITSGEEFHLALKQIIFIHL